MFAKHVATVAEAKDEILVPEMCVVAHQVPNDRPVADRDERLWNGLGMLAQPGPEATAEEDDFHRGPRLAQHGGAPQRIVDVTGRLQRADPLDAKIVVAEEGVDGETVRPIRLE